MSDYALMCGRRIKRLEQAVDRLCHVLEYSGVKVPITELRLIRQCVNGDLDRPPTPPPGGYTEVTEEEMRNQYKNTNNEMSKVYWKNR